MIHFLLYAFLLAQLLHWCILQPLSIYHDAEGWRKCLLREEQR